jgi:hypothetical protein
VAAPLAKVTGLLLLQSTGNLHLRIAARVDLPQDPRKMTPPLALSTRLRALAAGLAFAAIALAAALSVAPQLHDWLHSHGDRGNHECAATLMSSGSVQEGDCQPIRTCPQDTPAEHTFRAQPFARVLAAIGSSLLEHAPPARA